MNEGEPGKLCGDTLSGGGVPGWGTIPSGGWGIYLVGCPLVHIRMRVPDVRHFALVCPGPGLALSPRG